MRRQPRWDQLGDVRRMGLSFVDQAAYGLSTFLVTAMVSRSTGAADFSRFIVLWTAAWTVCALATEFLVTPLRVALPRGDVAPEVVADVQGVTFVTALSCTAAAGVAVGLGYEPVASLLSVLAIALSGLSFTVRRCVLYTTGSIGRSVANSALNLAATIVLLMTLQFMQQPTSRWGLVAAGLALLMPLIISLPRRWPTNWRIGWLLPALSRSGAWLAVAVGLRGLVYTSGLLALVEHLDGPIAAATLGYTFVLASPVQLASSVLPLLFLPSLVRSQALDRPIFQRTLRRQLHLYAACASVALLVLLVAFDWWRTLLVHGPDATGVAYAPVALYVLGVLFSSWLSDVVLAVRSPAFLLGTTVVGAVAALLGAAIGIHPPYLASVPYGAAILAQTMLIMRTPEVRTPLQVGR